MAIDFRENRYLIDKSRRRVNGVLVTVGSGGTIPAKFQTMLDQIASAQAGGKREFVTKAKADMRDALKRMQGRVIVLAHDSPIMFVDSAASLKNAMRSAKWSVPEQTLAEAFPMLLAAQKRAK